MNRIIGSILIVAGTTIGAGMLAMPIISANVGFGTMCLILCTIWLAMYYTSIILVDVYSFNTPEDGLNTLTVKYLGKAGATITAVSMLSLMYALVSAYIAGGGDILKTNLNQWLGIILDSKWSGLLFTLLFGGIISLGTRLVDLSTKVVFTIKLVFLFLVILFLTPHIKSENLTQLPTNGLLVLSTIPVIFTSFGFHVVIPSLVQYLNGDTKKLKKVFFIGSSIPLVIYLIWEVAVLGSIESTRFSEILGTNSGLEGLILAIQEIQKSHITRIAISIFAAAAIVTSFWGVSLALFHYIIDLSKKKPLLKKPTTSFFLTFFPPLVFALFYPDGFIIALGYASISLVILALVMPMLMLKKAQKQAGITPKLTQNICFALLWLLSIIIIVLQLLMGFGVIRSL